MQRALLPDSTLRLILDEVQGDIAYDNMKILAPVERLRPEEEYTGTFFEADYVATKARQYGLSNVRIEKLASKDSLWRAIQAELWLTAPELKKLISAQEISACLVPNSHSMDTTAELVYVGDGSAKALEGIEVRGKILLTSGPPDGVHNRTVWDQGAIGVVSYHSLRAEDDPDQVLWEWIPPERESDHKPSSFAFKIPPRLGWQLRERLAKGEKLWVHARVQARFYPGKLDVVVAEIPGTTPSEESFLFTAHLFEGFAKQGANDNISGSVAILEVARAIRRLIENRAIPSPKRTLRFLWVPEFDGTIAYLAKYPETSGHLLGVINMDMVGESLRMNNSSFHLHRTPDSRPSYLNDVIENFIEYVGETNREILYNRPTLYTNPILSLTGTRDAFFYQIETYYGSSDHHVFNDWAIGVPAVMLIAWPDQWYHSNQDRPDKADPTQLRRAAFIGAAVGCYIAAAGPEEALEMAGQVAARGRARVAFALERSLSWLNQTKTLELKTTYQEAKNLVHQNYLREAAAIQSALAFAGEDAPVREQIREMATDLLSEEALTQRTLRDYYRGLCRSLGVAPEEPKPTTEELAALKKVPVRTEKVNGYFEGRFLREHLKDEDRKLLQQVKLRDLAPYECRNFIDGKRSVLEIRNALAAEFGPTPLEDVEFYIDLLQKAGAVAFKK